MSDLTTDGTSALAAPRLPLPDRWFAYGLPVLDVLLSSAVGIAVNRLMGPGSVGACLGSLTFIGFCSGIIYVTAMRIRGAYGLPKLIGRAEPWRSFALLVLGCDGLALAILAMSGVRLGVPLAALVIFTLFQLGCVATGRVAIRAAASALLQRGLLSGSAVILVGTNAEIDGIDRISLLATHGLQDVGRIGIGDTGALDDALFDAIVTLSRRCLAERIIVTIGRDSDRLAQLRRGLRRSALPVTLLRAQGVADAKRGRAGIDLVGSQLIELQSGAISSATLRLKRSLDVLLSLGALLLLSPLLPLLALLIKLDSRGPVIFRQRRHGFDRRPFFIYKFRSMSVAEDGASIRQVRRGDARVTRIGRMIRRASIDELPQLINVLRGDMSLVGPRPHAVAHDDAYTAIVERYALRHHVRPGLTGWAQINGARGETSAVHQMQRRIDLDLWYIDHFSIWLDLAILCRTCVEVVKNDAF